MPSTGPNYTHPCVTCAAGRQVSTNKRPVALRPVRAGYKLNGKKVLNRTLIDGRWVFDA